MAFYQALIPPPGAGGLREEVEQARLLPESFTFSAFVFGGVWLLYKRLWLAFILYALVWGGLVYAQRQLGFAVGAVVLSQLALGLFLGFEGQNLIARKLLRVNLSDIAAMGAVPRHYLLAISIAPGIG